MLPDTYALDSGGELKIPWSPKKVCTPQPTPRGTTAFQCNFAVIICLFCTRIPRTINVKIRLWLRVLFARMGSKFGLTVTLVSLSQKIVYIHDIHPAALQR